MVYHNNLKVVWRVNTEYLKALQSAEEGLLLIVEIKRIIKIIENISGNRVCKGIPKATTIILSKSSSLVNFKVWQRSIEG